MSIGIPASEFWDMTLYELNLTAKGYVERKKCETKELISQAYLISRWVWAKRIDINGILAKAGQERKVMTDEQMLQTVKALNAVFGGKVKAQKKD